MKPVLRTNFSRLKNSKMYKIVRYYQLKNFYTILDLFDNSVSFGTLIFTYSVVCCITLILYQIRNYVNTIVINDYLNISIIIKN